MGFRMCTEDDPVIPVRSTLPTENLPAPSDCAPMVFVQQLNMAPSERADRRMFLRDHAHCRGDRGITERARVISRFLEREMAEYEALRREFELLRHEGREVSRRRYGQHWSHHATIQALSVCQVRVAPLPGGSSLVVRAGWRP